MVLIDLKEVFQHSPTYEGDFTLDSEDLSFPEDAGQISSPVEVSLRLEKERGGYLANLEISTKVDLECSRCLNPFTRELHLSTSKHIERPPREDNLELTSADLEVSFLEEDVLILEDLVREEILLGLSMKPLCSPDCRGIHPGAILEEENTGKGDPRFAILKNLLD